MRNANRALATLDDDYAGALMTFDRGAILRETVRLLTDRYGFHAAWIAEGGAPGATIAYTSGMRTRVLDGLLLRSGCGLGGKVFAKCRAEWVDDYRYSSLITHHYDGVVEDERIRAMIAAPLAVDGQPPSVILCGARDGSTFGSHAAAVLERIARQATDALQFAARARVAAERAIERERDARLAAILTPRECDVLRGFAAGDSNAAIAARLGVSVNTVKTHARTLMDKLGAHNRAQAVDSSRRSPGLAVRDERIE